MVAIGYCETQTETSIATMSIDAAPTAEAAVHMLRRRIRTGQRQTARVVPMVHVDGYTAGASPSAIRIA